MMIRRQRVREIVCIGSSAYPTLHLQLSSCLLNLLLAEHQHLAWILLLLHEQLMLLEVPAVLLLLSLTLLQAGPSVPRGCGLP